MVMMVLVGFFPNVLAKWVQRCYVEIQIFDGVFLKIFLPRHLGAVFYSNV